MTEAAPAAATGVDGGGEFLQTRVLLFIVKTREIARRRMAGGLGLWG